MKKPLIGVVVLIVVIAGAYGAWRFSERAPSVKIPDEDIAPLPTQMATSTYATSTFSIVYPVDFRLDDSYAYEGVPNKPIAGVKFTVPEQMAIGTNLSSDSYLSVEWLPRALNCTGDIYLLADVQATDQTDVGVEYSVATSSGAAAGSHYEEQVFAFSGSSPCTAVRYFIHTTSIGNYATGTATMFDRARLINAFDSIRRSLTLTP